MPYRLLDRQALDQIASLLSAKEWSPDTLDAIADVVRATDRVIEDVDDVDEEVG